MTAAARRIMYIGGVLASLAVLFIPTSRVLGL